MNTKSILIYITHCAVSKPQEYSFFQIVIILSTS